MPAGKSYPEEIDRELATARTARQRGNEGMVRVCARRAAGAAITWYLTHSSRPEWGTNALSQLRGISQDQSFSQEARDAALRLTERISGQFGYRSEADPLEDAGAIIREIVRLMGPGAE